MQRNHYTLTKGAKKMTDNGEGTQTRVEETEQASPNLSQGEGVQQPSQQDSPSKADFDRLVKEHTDLKKQFRGMQGKQDKLESDFTQRLKSLGVELTPEQQSQAKVMDLEDKVEFLYNQLDTQEPATPASQNTVDHAAIIAREGLNPNDPKLIELASQYSNDAIGFAVEVGKYKSQPAPAGGATTPAGSGNPPRDSDLEMLQKDINTYTEALNRNDISLANQLQQEFLKKHGNAWKNIKWHVT